MRIVVVILTVLAAGTVSGSPFDEAVAVAALGGDRMVVARGRDRAIDVIRLSDGSLLTSADGPSQPSLAVASPEGDRAAVLDAVGATVHIVRSGGSIRVSVPSSPVAATFLGEDLFVLCRESSRLVKIAPEGTTTTAPVREDSVFLARGDSHLWVYARRDGVIQEIDPRTLTLSRSATVMPFGSDFEVDGRYGYLVSPRDASVVSFSLSELREVERFGVGATPTDLALQGRASATGAGVLAVADPSSKRVWRTEGSQSMAAAFARGFLRGLIGLGLGPSGSTGFPTGVDRVWTAGRTAVAYDSATGTVYDVSKEPRRIASGVPAAAVSVLPRRVVFWDSAAGRIRTVALP